MRGHVHEGKNLANLAERSAWQVESAGSDRGPSVVHATLKSGRRKGTRVRVTGCSWPSPPRDCFVERPLKDRPRANESFPRDIGTRDRHDPKDRSRVFSSSSSLSFLFFFVLLLRRSRRAMTRRFLKLSADRRARSMNWIVAWNGGTGNSGRVGDHRVITGDHRDAPGRRRDIDAVAGAQLARMKDRGSRGRWHNGTRSTTK